MGFSRTYAQAIVFGSTTHGGLGSINLRIEQGIMIVAEIMRTLQTPRHRQDILQIFLQTFQHASGFSLPLLEYPEQWAPYLEGHYYILLRKFLAEHKLQLKCECVDRPKLERNHDLFLMDAACAKPKHKWVILMWELSIIVATTLRSSAYPIFVQPTDSLLLSRCGMETVQLHKVNLDLRKSSKTNRLRKNEPCRATFWNHFVMKKSQCLIRGLGQWTTTIQTSQRLWPFYYSRKTGILYRGYPNKGHNNKKYQFDEHKHNEDDVFAFEPVARNVELKYIPTDAVPVDIARARHGWLICHFHTLKPHPAITETTRLTDLTHFIKL